MSQNSEGDIIIQFSARLAEALSDKVVKHNELCSDNEVSISQVTKVYKHAANSYPQESLGELGINKWCLARVNMYLRMKCGDISSIDHKSQMKKKMSSLIFENVQSSQVNTFFDLTDDCVPNEIDFSAAQEDSLKYDLNYDFESLDDIYFAEREDSDYGHGLDFDY